MNTQMIDFLKDLCHPDAYGWAVSSEVRSQASKLLKEMKMDYYQETEYKVSEAEYDNMISDKEQEIKLLKETIMDMQVDLEFYDEFLGSVRTFMLTSTDPNASKFLKQFQGCWQENS